MWTSQEIRQQFTGPKTVKVEETALDLTDANDSYSPSDYAFDLFTTEYKFRVLTMRLGAVYPIDLVLDDDIFRQTPRRFKFQKKMVALLFKMTMSSKVA